MPTCKYKSTGWTIVGGALLAGAGLTGCGGDGKVPVAGKITWNNEPIAKGHIAFMPVNPAQTPDATAIVGGNFSLRALPGEKRVEVFADRPVGAPDPVMRLQRYEQYIPTRYNEQSELKVTINSSGENVLTLSLTEQPGDKKAGGASK